MTTNKILAVDIDSTLADIMPVFIRIVEQRYGIYVDKEDINTWDFWIPVIGKAAMWDVFREVWVNHWQEIEPTEPDVADSLVKALGMGYQISIITSAQRDNIPYIMLWLQKYRIPYGSIIALHKFQSKTAYPWDVIIDDNPSMQKEILVDPFRKVLLFDQPWNRHVDEWMQLRRVRSFDEALQEL